MAFFSSQLISKFKQPDRITVKDKNVSYEVRYWTNLNYALMPKAFSIPERTKSK